MTRRSFLQLGGVTLGALGMTRWRAQSLPLSTAGLPDLDHGPPLLGLATSLAGEEQYDAEVRGTLPVALRGRLYRNGPGRFDRSGLRKRSILDGDGLVQAFYFDGGGRVRFRSRFVRTEKFRDEEAAGRFLYATWTTQAPGGVLANLFGRSIRNQAGVSVVARNGALFAFDESAQPYELDPETLDTIGLSDLGVGDPGVVFAAHSKVDAATGEWIHFGLEYGRTLTVHLTVFAADGRLRSHRTFALPRYVYIHDFFVSERWMVLNLHPAEISLLPFLLGRRSLADSITWRPEQRNLLMVIPRDGSAPPVLIPTEDAAWMWHALNAYDVDGEIVADFVGYREPDHFLGPDAAFAAIMEGRAGESRAPGELRRYVIDVPHGRARHETIAGGRHEYPFLDPRRACRRHRVGYVASARDGDPYFTGISAVDTANGRVDAYWFDAGLYCGEPVFAPDPAAAEAASNGRDRGWLLTEVYDRRATTSFLAVLRSDRLADGPVGTVQLRHHAPLSLHGCWQSSR